MHYFPIFLNSRYLGKGYKGAHECRNSYKSRSTQIFKHLKYADLSKAYKNPVLSCVCLYINNAISVYILCHTPYTLLSLMPCMTKHAMGF